MNCNDFELLLADALGGELTEADRPDFEQHLAQCGTCREDYESTKATVSRLHSLSAGQPGEASTMASRRAIRRSPWHARTALLRYAASILLAFAAGYAVSGLRAGGSPRTVPRVTSPFDGPLGGTRLASASFGAAFAETYAEQPSGSELSRCLTAMFGKRN